MTAPFKLQLLAERPEDLTLALVWTIAAALSFASFLLCQWRRWAAFIAIGAGAIWLAILLPELHDHFLPPAIIEELGYGYGVPTYLAALAPFLCILIGLCRERQCALPPRRRRP
jgi:hypothetical protein